MFGTYRNLMLEASKGISPVCIGAGVLHKRKLQLSYYALPSLIVKYRPKTKGMLVIGTDGEKNPMECVVQCFYRCSSLTLRYAPEGQCQMEIVGTEYQLKCWS